MATEIVRWCDVHMGVDERVPGAAHAVKLDGRDGSLDLCEVHAKELLGPLLDLLAPTATRDRGPGGRRPNPGGVPCRVCGVEYLPGRMSSHLRKVHDTGAAEVYGLTCPVCGVEYLSTQALLAHAHG